MLTGTLIITPRHLHLPHFLVVLSTRMLLLLFISTLSCRFINPDAASTLYLHTFLSFYQPGCCFYSLSPHFLVVLSTRMLLLLFISTLSCRFINPDAASTLYLHTFLSFYQPGCCFYSLSPHFLVVLSTRMLLLLFISTLSCRFINPDAASTLYLHNLTLLRSVYLTN